MERFAPLVLIAGVLAACSPTGQETGDQGASSNAQGSSTASGEPNPDRNAYFGDLHVHTRYSFDAFAFGTTADPDASYAFAKGAPLQHPAGFEMKLDRPLDFQAVTDHGMYLGMLPAMTDPNSPAYNHPEGESMRNAKTADERRAMFNGMRPYLSRDPRYARYLDMGVVSDTWAEVQAAANRNYEPGKFTTFIAYEYTSAGGEDNNLHRNVIFKGDTAPASPFTRIDSPNPEDLWERMDEWRSDGFEVLAIPHNSNGSNGRMFELETFDGGVIDDAYAQQRMRNEPVVEVTQVKGTSETHPALSPNDEWANFEIMPYRIASTNLSQPDGSYVRQAFLRGLQFAEEGLTNPYKFGLIGSSDTHNAAGSFYEDNYWSKVGLLDATPEMRGSVPGSGVNQSDGQSDASVRTQDGSGRTYRDTYYYTWGASGLAGVWAEENTREAIFDAMRRKETFATSGSRIRVRFFGGADIEAADLDSTDVVSRLYAEGVPMGGDLYASDHSAAPKFTVWALRDPLAAPLQRIQIVKGWIDDGEAKEAVIDVACSDGLSVDPSTNRCPDNGAGVDMTTCAVSGDAGADEIKAVWTDPDFDPNQRAFYYVRVLENPTCRWSTWDAVRSGVEPRRDVPATIQERAWTAPIWFNPS